MSVTQLEEETAALSPQEVLSWLEEESDHGIVDQRMKAMDSGRKSRAGNSNLNTSVVPERSDLNHEYRYVIDLATCDLLIGILHFWRWSVV